MFKSFSVLRFRGLSRCDIQGMRRVTILTGKNNAGKTAALESMFIHSGNHNPNLIMVVNAIRGLNKIQIDTSPVNDAPWLSAFTSYDDSQPIKLTGELLVRANQFDTKVMQISTVKNHTEFSGLGSSLRVNPSTPEGLTAKMLKVELTEGRKPKSKKHFLYYEGGQPVVVPPMPMLKYQTRFLSPHIRDSAEERAAQFGRLQIEGKVDLLADALREIEPRLKDLALVFNGEPMLHGDIGLTNRKLIPVAVMGDGVSRIASLLLAIGSTPGGVVLIDDIDTGLHHSVMNSFWSSVLKAAIVFDVQVVATTHSDECVRAALEAFTKTGNKDQLSAVRMERKSDHVEAYTYDADDIKLAFQTGLEVR